MINVVIDGKPVSVNAGSMILDAARSIGIDVPTLCYMRLHNTEYKCQPASCRVCVVEVEGRRNLCPACATPVMEGMVIKTNSMRVLQSRKMIVELMISDHPNDCLTCTKSGKCELQDLARKTGVVDIPLSGKEQSEYPVMENKAIVRDMSKCIMCRRCEEMCSNIQSVHALSGVSRGFEAVVGTAFDESLDNTMCVGCGQCVAVCPVGALMEKDDTDKVIKALANPDVTVVFQTAPATRVAIGEEFGMKAGTNATGKMVTALKNLGADYVFDTDFTADLTIMEEGTELIGRLTKFLNGEKAALPLLTSCCPGWVNFYESRYPDMLELPSTAKSPQGMFGAVAKNYFAEKLDIDRKKMFVVSVMPCTAKKIEADRAELKEDGIPDVDVVLTTREIARLIKMANIDFVNLTDSEYDNPLGESTGAAVIFGVTGGVLEAALRTVYEVLEKKTLPRVEFEAVRGFEGLKVATVTIAGQDINVAVAHGLANASKVMDEIKNGNPRNLHAVEVMACPGGCIGGGGQPYHHGDGEILKARTNATYQIDEEKTIRKSHENPAVKALYEEYYKEPGSEIAHHQLHTHYTYREKY
ncbi:NADH-dependent [FeFe] hydrogenase, group A6 [Anaerosporobacter sp.]|uniref:NADH-dependent [FeFe] hydrogenase, group A6 n=1 Tax=Anaerosporobacter sp. TaxID=1872529 RepID=UPI00286F6FC6|nr:NADH-dependent [FeFe] hydrogenase, group A6 [Anaerosporobacter sp.]